MGRPQHWPDARPINSVQTNTKLCRWDNETRLDFDYQLGIYEKNLSVAIMHSLSPENYIRRVAKKKKMAVLLNVKVA